MSENTNETNSFWNDLGTTLAKGATAAGKGTLFGSVWLAHQVTKGACQVSKAGQATGKAFKDEWQRQGEDK